MKRSNFYSNLKRSITNIVRKDLDPISRKAISKMKEKPNNLPDVNNEPYLRSKLKNIYLSNKERYIDRVVGENSYNFFYDSKPEVIYEEKTDAPIGITVTDKYVIEEYPKPKQSEIVTYRTKKVYSDKYKTYILLKIAILKNGETKLTSIWFPKDSEKAKDIMKMYNITESRVPIIVTANKRPPIVKKLAPIQIELAGKLIKPKVIARKADVGTTWKTLKGAK